MYGKRFGLVFVPYAGKLFSINMQAVTLAGAAYV